MDVSAITAHTPDSAAAAIRYAPNTPLRRSSDPSAPASPAEVKKAVQQFEAIIVRQLLAPSVEPLVSGGLGGAKTAGGGGMYAYMMTDVLADNLAHAGGLGLGRMLEKQFTAAPAHAPTAAPLSSQALLFTQPSSPSTQ